jgi:hypothetical protein
LGPILQYLGDPLHIFHYNVQTLFFTFLLLASGLTKIVVANGQGALNEYLDSIEVIDVSSGVNFINILCMNFSYECRFGSFFYINITREKLPKQCSYEKFVRKMLMKLTTEGINCQNLPDFPIIVQGQIGGLLHERTPLLCGGDYLGKRIQTCYTLDKNNNTWMQESFYLQLVKITRNPLTVITCISPIKLRFLSQFQQLL